MDSIRKDLTDENRGPLTTGKSTTKGAGSRDYLEDEILNIEIITRTFKDEKGKYADKLWRSALKRMARDI